MKYPFDDDELPEANEQQFAAVPDSEGAEAMDIVWRNKKIKALVQKLHVNTGHASIEQILRFAKRYQSSSEVQKAIRISDVWSVKSSRYLKIIVKTPCPIQNIQMKL